MDAKFKVVLLVVLQIGLAVAQTGDFIELSEYYRMPKTYEYDDYDQCLSDVPVGQVAAYCLVRVVIKPDDESDRWHWIKEFSSDQKRHMNHALLDRGICIEHCKKLARELSNETRQALKVEKFDFDFPYIFDVSVFKDTPKDRERYADLVETCINYKLNKTYQLTAYTEIEVCDKNEEQFEVDSLDLSFLVILALLILLMVASTLYDKRINYKRSDDHYREELTSKKKAFFASFSILRNWYRLTSRSQGNVHKMFRPLQAVRFITTVMVIMGHAVLIAGITPNSNTFWIETLYHNIAVMILTGGTQVVQIFLTMSGFLVAYHVLVHPGFAKKGLGLLFLVKAIVLRYIRLTPMYAFVVLLHATWLIKLQDGPMWKRGVETERTFCRRNWWTNLLYVNNFVNADQPCVQQTWYLGCDYQLYCAGILLVIVISWFRKRAVLILMLAAIGAFILTAVHIYMHELEGVFVIIPEAQRFVLWFDKRYHNSYIPFEVNTGNYLIGIIAAYLLIHIRNNNIDPMKKAWFRILWPFVLPLAIASLLLHYIFYVNDFETPSVWMSIFYPAMKYSWGICLVWFAYGVLYGNAPVLKRFLNHRIFEPLGRLAYATFLSHTFIMRLLFLNTRSPQHSNILGMTGMVFSSVVLSYSMATFLCLSMELPVSALQKLLFGKQDVEAAPKKPEVPQVASSGEAQPNGDSKSENTA
ncbi:nose resistant to fluoxetine protein 6-like [Culex pipiens pallens]|uniref:nose resistant to fluoxetine protein 6-like n=1 Tax=Culex pipiens pallens TaxID=42434 RepID=UPI0022AA60A2|nr:nose resistant to fluoxetine protein 6-like [Culex pipiens pallens]